MEMKTSVVKPTPWGADNGINRIALAVLVAAGALSAMGVGLTIFLIVISDGATLYGAAFWLGIVSAWAGFILHRRLFSGVSDIARLMRRCLLAGDLNYLRRIPRISHEANW